MKTAPLSTASLIACVCFLPWQALGQEARAMSTAEVNQSITATRQAKISTTLSTSSGGRLLIKTSDGEIEAQPGTTLPSRFINLPADVKVQDFNDLGLLITEIAPKPSPTWESMSLPQRRAFQGVDQAQGRLKAAMTQALTNEGNESSYLAAHRALGDVKSEIVMAYGQLSAAERQQRGRLLVDSHSEMEQLERNYFRKDYNERYAPETYQRIHASTRSAAALRVKGQPLPQCSGVLISKNQFLTNRHCVSTQDASQLEVVFDYEEDLQGTPMPHRTYPVSAIRFRDGDPFLDFSILELGPDAAGSQPGDVYPSQCIARSEPKHKEAIYVVGFPLGEPRVVHDNTHVYFPFRINEDEYFRLEISVREEFRPGAEEDQAYADGKIREFMDSYRQVLISGTPMFEYYSQRFGRQPTMGVDSDTYAGNSGSPAFHRRTHAVVGLLFDGHQASNQPWAPGWRMHEAVLPASKIVEAITSQDPTWISAQGICFR